MSERDERLRKLEPKLGDQTTRALWLAAQDAKLRKHVDPFISALGDSLLDESYKHERILLPPPRNVAGPVHVGTVTYDEPRGSFGLQKRELVRHVGIVGSSGSGKTTAALKVVQSALEAGARVVVFDVKRTWRTLLEHVPAEKVRVFTLSRPEVSPFHFNFLIPPDHIPAELYDQIMSLIADETLYGGLGSQSIAKEALTRLRAQYPMPASRNNHFTMLEFSREVQRVSGEMRMQKRAGDWSATAVRIAKELASPPLGRVVNVRRNVLEDDLDKAQLVVFETDLFSQPQFTYLVTAFLAREYLKRLDTDRPDELEMLVVFEEAANIFGQPYPQPTFDRMLREVREKGLGICWLSQAASEVNATAWANTNTLLVFRQINAKDINAVGAAVAFEQSKEKKYVARLGVGECIVRLPDRCRTPFLVKSDDIPKIVVSDDRVRELAMAHLRELGAPIFDLEPEPAPPVPGVKKASEPVRQEAETPGVPCVPVVVSAPGATGALGGLATSGEPSKPVSRTAGAPEALVSQSTEAVRPTSRLERNRSAMAHLLNQIANKPNTPVTYVYAQLQMAKSVGDRTKKALLARGLAEEMRVPGLGGIQKHLRVTDAGARWLSAHGDLLTRPLVRWATKRFGGPRSELLSDVVVRWGTRVRGARYLGAETPVGFAGRRWDHMFEDADGGRWVAECCTGESKLAEAQHVAQAIALALPIVTVCWDDGIRERVRRYLRDQNIAECENVVLVTAKEIAEELAADSNAQSAAAVLFTAAGSRPAANNIVPSEPSTL